MTIRKPAEMEQRYPHKTLGRSRRAGESPLRLALWPDTNIPSVIDILNRSRKARMVRWLDHRKHRVANRSRAAMETNMQLDVQERRMSVCLAGVVDDALDLAEECGWRYAIVYLISEKVPSSIIQRLLFGGGRVRRSTIMRRDGSPAWKGSNVHEMRNLFDWLRQRRSAETCEHNDTSCASRSNVCHEID
jgi:hypothetical protein